MKAKIIIEYIGKFTEQDLVEEVLNLENEIREVGDSPFSKFDSFKVSYKIKKETKRK